MNQAVKPDMTIFMGLGPALPGVDPLRLGWEAGLDGWGQLRRRRQAIMGNQSGPLRGVCLFCMDGGRRWYGGTVVRGGGDSFTRPGWMDIKDQCRPEQSGLACGSGPSLGFPSASKVSRSLSIRGFLGGWTLE